MWHLRSSCTVILANLGKERGAEFDGKKDELIAWGMRQRMRDSENGRMEIGLEGTVILIERYGWMSGMVGGPYEEKNCCNYL